VSDLTLGRRVSGLSDPFRTGTIVLILAVGILGFVGMLVLGAFAPDLRSGHDGGTHALSNAGIGFSGIVQLAETTGRHPLVIRNEHQRDSEDLLVVTPGSGSAQLGDFFTRRKAKPTLYILPKWWTAPDRDHRGWVDLGGLMPPEDPGSLIAPNTRFEIKHRRAGRRPLVPTRDFGAGIDFRAPPLLQVITGVIPSKDKDDGTPMAITPLLTDRYGGIVIARVGEGPLYVLADPDLMNNVGLKDKNQAAAALAMLDWMNSNGATTIGFDVTMNGFGHAASPLKLAFTPPFLAMTIALAAVLLLVGWHAIGRFGPVRPRERAIALGKSVLVENSAKLMHRARRGSAGAMRR
jgi:hypothetical protein